MNSKKRKDKRIDKFYKSLKKYEEKGYLYKNLTISMNKANFLSILIALPLCVIIFAIYFITNSFLRYDYSFFTLISLLIHFILLVIIHELIHAFTWGLFAENKWQAVSIHMAWETLTPYCTCSDALPLRKYIIGASMPLFLLGLIPGIFSILLSNEFLLLLSLSMVLCAGGDMLIIIHLLRNRLKKNEIVLYLDHPTECGATLLYKGKEH